MARHGRRAAILLRRPANDPNRPESAMPRTFEQGLYFMLGLLLSFYVLLPLIGVKV